MIATVQELHNNPPPIRVLLANHQPIIRSGIRLLLDKEPDLKVIAEAANGREAVVLADYQRPDVALVEVRLPLVDGNAVTRYLTAKNSGVAVVFVTSKTDRSYVNEAFNAGAYGYVDEDCVVNDLARAIRVVARGRLFLSPSICVQLLSSHLPGGTISSHERDLWCLIAAGSSEVEAANQLQSNVEQIRMDMQSDRSVLCWKALPEAFARSLQKLRPAMAQAISRTTT